VTRLGRPKLKAKAPTTALIAPLAPTIGTMLAGAVAHCVRAEAYAPTKYSASRPKRPSTRSTWVPHQKKISRLNPMWIGPECTRVAVSGVRNAGTAGEIATNPLKRAGTKPRMYAVRSGEAI